MEDGRWMMEDAGVAFGDDSNKKASFYDAYQNHSLFTIHHLPDAQKERPCRSF